MGCPKRRGANRELKQDTDNIIITTSDKIDKCKYLGEVEANGGRHGIIGAKRICRQKAVKLNGTHIVWYHLDGVRRYVSGLVYRCK